jgi:hypothetical protein
VHVQCRACCCCTAGEIKQNGAKDVSAKPIALTLWLITGGLHYCSGTETLTGKDKLKEHDHMDGWVEANQLAACMPELSRREVDCSAATGCHEREREL